MECEVLLERLGSTSSEKDSRDALDRFVQSVRSSSTSNTDHCLYSQNQANFNIVGAAQCKEVSWY